MAVDEHGIVKITAAGEPSLSQSIFLLVPKPQWQGTLFSQEGWVPQSVEKSPDGTTWRVKGVAEWDGGSMEIAQTVELREGRAVIEYRCRPLAGADTEGARLIVRVPTRDLGGRGRFMYRSGRIVFSQLLPAQLPSEYHLLFLHEADWTGWGLDDRALINEHPGGWLRSAALQDDRRFKMEVFELQLEVADTRVLKTGKEFSCRIETSAASLKRIEASGVVIVEAANKWEVARVDLRSQGQLGIGEISWSSRGGPRWKPVELSFDVTGTWDNPFDPQQIDVYAVIERRGGESVRQPAFAYQEYDALSPGGDILKPRGPITWRVRWTPLEEGEYRVTIAAETPQGRVTKTAGVYNCQGSDGRGFIRRSPDTPYYLRFDDGTPYFAIGENICWDGDDILAAYERWFSRLGAAGGNYCRIWLVRWNMALEWSPEDGARRGCYYGLGRYSLDNAWRLDRVIELAQKHGIYVMLCLGYHGELYDQPDYFHSECWQLNPYNKALGGPCQKPEDFWTNPDARRLYKQRLRYYLARWGAYPNVLSWEFWNEVWAPAEWIKEMGEYLGANDIHHHLRTTTYGRDDTWLLDVMDYSQAHHYGADDSLPDSAPVISATSWEFTEKYRKPFMMGEFGIDWKRSDANHDPEGRATNFHNGLWASIASRSFGTAAIWYWDNYVDKLNLYDQFTPVARFVREVDWTRFNPVRPEVQAVEPQAPADAPERFGPTPVPLAPLWSGQCDQPVELTRSGDLSVPPDAKGKPTNFLFGPSKKDMQSPLMLRLDMPADGRLTIRVGTVSALSELVVRVDGNEVVRKTYKAGPPGEGPYKETRYYEQWKVWQSLFDDEITIPLAAGPHLVELANAAGDWMQLSRLVVEPYGDRYRPEVYLVSDGRVTVGWLHNRESTWWTDRDRREAKELPPVRLRIGGIQDGAYRVRWYDTWRGDFLSDDEARAAGGGLELVSPPFKRDIALLVQPK
ncbi:MAG: DUF5060 domain-containing protein [Armatimonadetes bacterium]|nr:DUF5060 domain-containing protein [Armatimonadota bacterium]